MLRPLRRRTDRPAPKVRARRSSFSVWLGLSLLAALALLGIWDPATATADPLPMAQSSLASLPMALIGLAPRPDLLVLLGLAGLLIFPDRVAPGIGARVTRGPSSR